MNLARSRFALVVLALAILFPIGASSQSSGDPAAGQSPLLLRNPSLSKDKIAFLYADDVWTVSRQGGEAERLTSDGKVVAGPLFSPDGAEIAYSAHLNGNVDVYVMPAGGGVPRRITGIRLGAKLWAGHLTAKVCSLRMAQRAFAIS